MNNARRAELNKALDLLEKIKDDFESLKEILSTAAEEEQESFDNLSEGLQAAERGQRMEEVAGTLQGFLDELESLDLENMISEIDGCKE